MLTLTLTTIALTSPLWSALPLFPCPAIGVIRLLPLCYSYHTGREIYEATPEQTPARDALSRGGSSKSRPDQGQEHHVHGVEDSL